MSAGASLRDVDALFQAAAVGATAVVAGSAIFGVPDYAKAIADIRAAAVAAAVQS
jgi:pentose-5-phosphate-3-epimerase